MKDTGGDRAVLVAALGGKGAHVGFDEAIRNFPAELRGKKTKGAPHSGWQLLEHLRISQLDILDFCVNPNYKEMNWPDEYWPQSAEPPDTAAWDNSIAAFRKDLKAMQDLVANTGRDLHVPIPHGSGQTLFREALLVMDHNSYHVGQFVLLRNLLGIWPPKK
jgi:hypothetical protein